MQACGSSGQQIKSEKYVVLDVSVSVYACMYVCSPQRLAFYVAWLMWQVRRYVNPHRPCMTMVFHLTVANDCCAGPALTAAAKRVMTMGL